MQMNLDVTLIYFANYYTAVVFFWYMMASFFIIVSKKRTFTDKVANKVKETGTMHHSTL